MTQKEWIKNNERMLLLIRDSKFMLPIIQPTHNSQVERIFDKGIAGDGAKIGDYSNEKKGIYINPEYNIGSFPGEGKQGDKVFKSGEKHKTKYFDNYKSYRQFIKKETGFVNLRLTENLKIDYTNSLRFTNGRVTTSVNNHANVGKFEGSVAKYGIRTWVLTNDEQAALTERFGREYLKKL